VCELLLERERDYEPILQCYLLDPLRRQQAFNFLRNVLGNQGYLMAERAQHLLVENIKVSSDNFFNTNITLYGHIGYIYANFLSFQC
jgi:hypothetical protein